MFFLSYDIPDSVNNQIDGHACSGLGKAEFSKLIMGKEVLIPFKPIKPIRLTQVPAVRNSAEESLLHTAASLSDAFLLYFYRALKLTS